MATPQRIKIYQRPSDTTRGDSTYTIHEKVENEKDPRRIKAFKIYKARVRRDLYIFKLKRLPEKCRTCHWWEIAEMLSEGIGDCR